MPPHGEVTVIILYILVYCTLYVVDPYNLSAGNLALSRALGDFAFKRNEDRRPEDQIITGVLSEMWFVNLWF